MRKIRDESLRRRTKEAIEQVEAAEALREVPNLTKLSGSSGLYRIGDYRIGIAVEGDQWSSLDVCTAGISIGISRRASQRVMEKAGFEYERDVVHAGLPHVLYRITAAGWRERR